MTLQHSYIIMLNFQYILMIISIINVKLISLTLRYDVVMMYWNSVKIGM